MVAIILNFIICTILRWLLGLTFVEDMTLANLWLAHHTNGLLTLHCQLFVGIDMGSPCLKRNCETTVSEDRVNLIFERTIK